MKCLSVFLIIARFQHLVASESLDRKNLDVESWKDLATGRQFEDDDDDSLASTLSAMFVIYHLLHGAYRMVDSALCSGYSSCATVSKSTMSTSKIYSTTTLTLFPLTSSITVSEWSTITSTVPLASTTTVDVFATRSILVAETEIHLITSLQRSTMSVWATKSATSYSTTTTTETVTVHPTNNRKRSIEFDEDPRKKDQMQTLLRRHVLLVSSPKENNYLLMDI